MICSVLKLTQCWILSPSTGMQTRTIVAMKKLQRVISLNERLSSLRVLHGIKNADPFFEYTINPPFPKIRQNLKRCLEDSMVRYLSTAHFILCFSSAPNVHSENHLEDM